MKKLKKPYLPVIALLSFIAFAMIAEEVVGNESIISFDLKITSYIYTIRTPLLTEGMRLITGLGNPWVIAFVSVISLLIFISRKYKKELYTFLLSFSVSGIFVWGVKLISARPRPPIADALAVEIGYSFPSGHSLFAVTFYGLLAYFISKLIKQKLMKSLLTAFTITLILLIGFSRIYLGVHWTSDVIAGYLAGIGWLSLVIFVTDNKLK